MSRKVNGPISVRLTITAEDWDWEDDYSREAVQEFVKRELLVVLQQGSSNGCIGDGFNIVSVDASDVTFSGGVFDIEVTVLGSYSFRYEDGDGRFEGEERIRDAVYDGEIEYTDFCYEPDSTVIQDVRVSETW